MNITHTINSLPVRAGKTVLKSLVASLNQSIIGYARSHIRSEKYASPVREVLPSDKLNAELAAKHGVPTFDEYNELEVGKLAKEEGDNFLQNSGVPVVDTPMQLCQRFTTLRNWLEEMTENMIDFNPVYDSPFTVANSLLFQIERLPKPDMSALQVKSLQYNIPLSELISSSVKAAMDDYNSLIEDQSRILGIYGKCSDAQEDLRWINTEQPNQFADGGQRRRSRAAGADADNTPEVGPALERKAGSEGASLALAGLDGYRIPDGIESDIGNINIERLIAALPIPSQFKMAARMVTIMDGAMDKARELLTRPRQRGSDMAGEEYNIIRALRIEHLGWLHAFDKKNGVELDAYADRGGFLPLLPDMPSEEDLAATQRMKEDAAKLKASTTGAAYRAQMLATGPAVSAMETAAAAKRKAVMAAFEMEPVVQEVVAAPVKKAPAKKAPKVAPVMSAADAAFAKFASRNAKSL